MPRLCEITVPVLITPGRHDWIIPVAAAEEMARPYPNARLAVFENSGHSPQIEEVELWRQTGRALLRENAI